MPVRGVCMPDWIPIMAGKTDVPIPARLPISLPIEAKVPRDAR